MTENKKLNGVEADALEAAFNKSVSNTPTRFPESQVGQSPEPKEEEATFIERHLNIIMGKTLDMMIVSHIEKMWGGLEMASVQHFIETGKISGGFYLRLKEAMLLFARNWHNTVGGFSHKFAANSDYEERWQSPEGQGELERLRGLVSWLKQECTPGTMTADLSHDFAESLLNRLDNL